MMRPRFECSLCGAQKRIAYRVCPDCHTQFPGWISLIDKYYTPTIQGEFQFHARSTDPDTSHEAAELADADTICSRVLEIIRSYGASGCISDQVCEQMSEHRRQAVTPAYARLLEKHLIADSGIRRVASATGRRQRVMVAIDFAPTPQPKRSAPMTPPKDRKTAAQKLTTKERKHLDWLSENGATPTVVILAIMSAGRSRGWAPASIAEEIATWFQTNNSSKSTCTSTLPESYFPEDSLSPQRPAFDISLDGE